MPTGGAGGVWATRSGDFFASPYVGDATGLSDAKTYVAVSGGLVQLGPGLEALALGTFGATSSLVQVRNDGKILISRVRIADGVDPTKLLFFDPSGITTGTERTITLSNWSGTLPLPSGAGTSGQFLQSQGAAQPIWAAVTVGGATTRYLALSAGMWCIGSTTENVVSATGNYGDNSFSGTADRALATAIVIPGDFNTLTSWKVIWADSTAGTGNVVWRLGLKVLADAGDAGAANAESNTTFAVPGVANKVAISTVTSPTITLAAGNVVDVVLERRSSSDAADTCTTAVNFISLMMTYST